MECKCKNSASFNCVDTRINRYIMECKLYHPESRRSLLQELIDTLWNVNEDTTHRTTACIAELIDTLWNVNRLDT